VIETVATCPRCGTDLETEFGVTQCGICQHQFEVVRPVAVRPVVVGRPVKPQCQETRGRDSARTVKVVATIGIFAGMIAMMAAGVGADPVVGLLGAFAFCIGFAVFIAGRLME
jgi:hypothetical protein